MDGNFGLVHKTSSGVGHGQLASRHKNLFFEDQENVKEFLSHYGIDKKSNTSECSNFQAGNVIRSKIKTKKLDITGVFGSVCKHDIPVMMLDMTHGERLGYPAYILKKVLQNHTSNLVVMYDIACTLHRHLKKTMDSDVLRQCTFSVPVFHSFAHNVTCQLEYGQRFTSATGLTDGEGIERLWSYLRGFNKITKEMSINNRQDLLTDALLHHTFKAIHNLGMQKSKCN
ncbi:hypothetical protein DPMN_147077 [Dreissena polymorpha]|uniref:Uncharacterized protein n=1 Tax=Dreissena polymorpha TaxID=45954 RepID=A0A9D4J2N4_DREPO|nr:hypothetical protein DPMN_147077 [Dreissena polymorpha]